MKNKKYIIIQTIFILAGLAIMILSDYAMQFTVYIISGIDIYLYGLFSLIIFGPILALYFMRKDNTKVLNLIFRIFTSISIIIIVLSLIFELSFSFNIIEFCLSLLIYIILLGLFIGALIVNIKLTSSELSLLKLIKDNKKLAIVVLSIVVVSVFAIWQWYKAETWVSLVQSNDGWYKFPWFGRESIWSAYNIAFKRIVLFAGLVYSSLFLILYTLKDKK